MKIAISSYSFNQAIKSGKHTQLSVIQEAYNMGLRAIEFTDLTPCEGVSEEEYARQIRAEADRLSMEIPAYTISADLCKTGEEADLEVERIKHKLDIAKILGAKVLRHDACFRIAPGFVPCFEAILPVLADNARKITEYAATLGIKTCTENHGLIAQDSDRVEKLVAMVNHPNYGLLVDIGNFACVDENSIHAVSRVGNLAVHVHAKDFNRRSFEEGPKEGYFPTRGMNYLQGTITGEGFIPVKHCLAILKKFGYNGYCSIEYEGPEDCFVAIPKCIQNLTNYLQELG